MSKNDFYKQQFKSIFFLASIRQPLALSKLTQQRRAEKTGSMLVVFHILNNWVHATKQSFAAHHTKKKEPRPLENS